MEQGQSISSQVVVVYTTRRYPVEPDGIKTVEENPSFDLDGKWVMHSLSSKPIQSSEKGCTAMVCRVEGT